MRGPRLEFAVGTFLLLTLASLMVLAVASTNQRWSMGSNQYTLTAHFTQIGQLRKQAPVRISGVNIGQVSNITLDPKTFESVVTLSLDKQYKDLPADTSANILTSGLLGELHQFAAWRRPGSAQTWGSDRIYSTSSGLNPVSRKIHVQWRQR